MQKKFRRPLEYERRPSYLLRKEYDKKLKERMDESGRVQSPARQEAPEGRQEEPQPPRAAQRK